MNRVDGVGNASIFRGDPRAKEALAPLERWLSGLLEKGKEGVIEARPYLYGSDAGFCARRNVLLQNNSWIGNTVNSAGRGYMAIGVAFEGLLVDALKAEGRLLSTQFRPESLPDLQISAKVDALILDSGNNLALLEVKTCGRLPEGPEERPTHLAQAQMYAALTGVRNTHLVYMSRELSPLQPIQIRTFQVDTGDRALLRVLQTANESKLAAEVAALPPVPGWFRKHTECHYCEFRDYFCWGSRPGLGGEGAKPPLRELSGEEYIRLTATARERAEGHLAGMPARTLATLGTLGAEPGLERGVRKRLLELEGLTLQEMAGAGAAQGGRAATLIGAF